VNAAIDERRSSFTGVALLLAAVAILLGALHLAAPVVTPVLLAIVLALIFWPLYVWLRGRGLGALAALVALLAMIVVGTALLAIVLGYSLGALASRMGVYAENLSARLQSVDALLASYGLSEVDLASLLPPQAVLAAFGAIVGGLTSVAISGLFLLLVLAFFLAEGPAIAGRVRTSLDPTDPLPDRLVAFGRDVGQYFVLRAAVNAVTGVGVTVVLWALGVDFPVLWGIVTFFLSFVPYIGMFLASVPSVLLAWAEYDAARALLVIVALTIVNATAENILQPALMHKGLNLSPTFVLLSVFFWSAVLGGGGAFLAIPMSLGALTFLATFPGARWFVNAATTGATGARDEARPP